ncbi:hypothetical protein [Aquimarina sp. BL5]|uniref:hypothetical protein n=1 Tax=Aquimarina sp. BL5 TaxID=1714860 RepID=UPI000EAAC383|nr:hypothetical protein [Aquimarina sp. BL5]
MKISYLDLEKLLYHNIKEIPNTILINNGDNKYINTYSLNGDFNFVDKPYTTLYISTDKDGIIQYFAFGINGVMDKSFYDMMVTKYGAPDEMTNIDEMITITEESKARNGIKSKESTYTLKKCRFEEKPLYIIWHKKDYKIKFLLKQGAKTTFKSIFVTIGNIDFYNDQREKELSKLPKIQY